MVGRILYVIGNLDVGGAERHLVQVLPKLARRGFSLTVYTFSHKGKLAPLLEDAGVEVLEPVFVSSLRKLPPVIRKPLLLLVSVPSFLFWLVRLRPAFVHFFLPEAYLLGGMCSLPFGGPIRIMSRRSLNRYQLKYPLLALVERWLHSRMDAVLGNSQAVVRELEQEGVSRKRLGLLYNGIDLEPFNHLPSRASIRKSMGIGEQALLMVCVANLIPYKGHADLIRALANICAELPDGWKIAMVGRDTGIGDELNKLAELLGVSEHILWLGERSDVIALYSAADIGVLCSHQEGFSNSVLEGLASTTAMVVTNVGGNAEAVLNGECGIVVPAHDPMALGGAILALAQDKDMRHRMAILGNARVKQKFSIDICIARYSNLYHSMFMEKGRCVQDAIESAQKDIKG